ncbi:hypothetical protein GPROT1_00802 [Gammaproteobacteria bacterium]|nr:hypothetical protein GPROT1_00802 [Gammaproteobacteria bacterium]
MSRRGSENRRKGKVVGVRVDDALYRVLRDRADELNVRLREWARGILQQHLAGAPRTRTPRLSVAISADDRALLQEFNRHAARLTGALIQAAKSARLGDMPQYHAALEHQLIEVQKMREVIDRLMEQLER